MILGNRIPFRPGIKKAASVAEGRSRGLNLIYLTGVVCVCVFACGASVGVGGVAELVLPAGGKLSAEADQSAGWTSPTGRISPTVPARLMKCRWSNLTP
jgi:hypothetical protein